MKGGEMKDIAKFIKRVVVDKEDTKKVNRDVQRSVRNSKRFNTRF